MKTFGFYKHGKYFNSCKANNINEANKIAVARKFCIDIQICEIIGISHQPTKLNIKYEIIN
jgi:hypothetical protein